VSGGCAYRIADNQTASLATWNYDLLTRAFTRRLTSPVRLGLSSFPATKQGAIDAADAGGMHHQGFDLARDKTKSKPTTKKLRAKDRPLANDFVSDAEFDRLLAAWFGNMARVLEPGRGFTIWGDSANLGNYPPFPNPRFALQTEPHYPPPRTLACRVDPLADLANHLGHLLVLLSQ
jgi:hypothetical protein